MQSMPTGDSECLFPVKCSFIASYALSARHKSTIFLTTLGEMGVRRQLMVFGKVVCHQDAERL